MGGERTKEREGRLSGSRRDGERRAEARRPGLRAAGVAGARVAAPILARRGGGTLGRLKAEWAAIVGHEVAALSWPAALGRDGALKLRVRAGFALDLQHRAPLVIERINQFFGHQAVARLVLVQGPLPLAAAATPAPSAAPSAAEAAALGARLSRVGDPGLRAALDGLGRLVFSRARGRAWDSGVSPSGSVAIARPPRSD